MTDNREIFSKWLAANVDDLMAEMTEAVDWAWQHKCTDGNTVAKLLLLAEGTARYVDLQAKYNALAIQADKLEKSLGMIERMKLFPDDGINSMTLSAAVHIATEVLTEYRQFKEGK